MTDKKRKHLSIFTWIGSLFTARPKPAVHLPDLPGTPRKHWGHGVHTRRVTGKLAHGVRSRRQSRQIGFKSAHAVNLTPRKESKYGSKF